MENYLAELETLLEARCKVSKNVTQHCDIDIAGDLIAGTLLSQIIYWFGIGENGRPRVRARHDGELWLAKSRKNWFDELRISPKQVDRAIKILLDKDLIIRSKKNYKWAGIPTMHIRPNYDVYNNRLQAWKDNVKQEIINEDPARYTQNNTLEPAPTMDFPQRVMSTFPKGKRGLSPKVNEDITERVTTITENLTKTSTLTSTQQQQETKNRVVVCEKYESLFQKKLTKKQAEDLITLADKHQVDLIKKMENTYKMHRVEPRKSIVAAIKYAIVNGDWEIASSTVSNPKPLPKAVADQLKGQRGQQELTREQLEAKKLEIQRKIAMLERGIADGF
jgi:hypothetical protein